MTSPTGYPILITAITLGEGEIATYLQLRGPIGLPRLLQLILQGGVVVRQGVFVVLEDGVVVLQGGVVGLQGPDLLRLVLGKVAG